MKLHSNNQSFEKLKANLFYVGIITLVTVVIWIAVSVQAVIQKPVNDPKIQTLIAPLNPDLDTQILMDFANSRTSPPETFKIIALTQNNNTATTQLIDPFADPTGISSSPLETKTATFSGNSR